MSPSIIYKVPRPLKRVLQVFAFDPSLNLSLETAVIQPARIERALGRCGARPVGEYLEVVDVDPASNAFYPPVDLDDNYLLVQDAWRLPRPPHSSPADGVCGRHAKQSRTLRRRWAGGAVVPADSAALEEKNLPNACAFTRMPFARRMLTTAPGKKRCSSATSLPPARFRQHFARRHGVYLSFA